jgi:aspartate aminotransferase
VRFSCAEPDEMLEEALAFLPEAFSRADRAAAFLRARPEYRLPRPYPV